MEFTIATWNVLASSYIANTHVKWDPPGTVTDRRFSVRQVTQLLEERRSALPPCEAWIVCGDFNATLESEPVRLMRDAGFAPTHVPSAGATCNPNGWAKMIDFVFVDRALTARPHPLFPVADDSVLPSEEIPSDHVPVVATIQWRRAPEGSCKSTRTAASTRTSRGRRRATGRR